MAKEDAAVYGKACRLIQQSPALLHFVAAQYKIVYPLGIAQLEITSLNRWLVLSNLLRKYFVMGA